VVPPLTNLAELIASVDASRPAADPLARLALAMEIARELESVGGELVGHYVDEARAVGLPWAQIGGVLGVSKQAAQQRFPNRTSIPVADFARFTQRARRAVEMAHVEARRRGHNYIGTEHLLLGVLGDPEALAGRVLDSLGAPATRIEAEIDRRVGAVTAGASALTGPGSAPIPFTPRATHALDLAADEALHLGHNYVGTEHELLGLLREPEGIASQALAALGIDHDTARAQVVFWLSGYRAGRGK